MRSWPLAFAISMCVAQNAWADRVAIVPATGAASPAENGSLDASLKSGVESLGHTIVELKEPIETQLTKRTREDAAQMGRDAGVDWVVFAIQDPAVTTTRVELSASFVKEGRLELVAREVDIAAMPAQVKEMLVVLLKPEGVGTGVLPWENLAPKKVEPKDSSGTVEVETPNKKPEAPEKEHTDYSDGNTVFIAIYAGADGIVMQPDNARGNAASLAGQIRAAAAIPSAFMEPFVQFGGRVAGSPALWGEVGVRVPFEIISEKGGLGLHVGPNFHLGVFGRLGSSTQTPSGKTVESAGEAAFTLGGSADVMLRINPRIQFDAQLGDLRWVPLEAGSTLSVGGMLGGGIRF